MWLYTKGMQVCVLSTKAHMHDGTEWQRTSGKVEFGPTKHSKAYSWLIKRDIE